MESDANSILFYNPVLRAKELSRTRKLLSLKPKTQNPRVSKERIGVSLENNNPQTVRTVKHPELGSQKDLLSPYPTAIPALSSVKYSTRQKIS